MDGARLTITVNVQCFGNWRFAIWSKQFLLYTARMPSPTPSVSAPKISRLAYIDWMRGLACVLMFQTHCYDSWLGGDARKGAFLMWSQLGGTLPAPLFLFLAGISFAFVVDKLRQKDLAASQIARTTIRRGAEIL